MKKTSLFSVLFALSMFLLVSCGGGSTTNDESNNDEDVTTEDVTTEDEVVETDNKIEKFISEDGSFKVNFMGTPEKEETTDETEAGIIKTVTYIFEGKSSAYMVAYSDYPEIVIEASTPSDMLNRVKEEYINKLGFVIKKEEEKELNGVPGNYFEASIDEYHSVVQDYLVKNRLYRIAILSADNFPTDVEIEGFIKSFEFVN